MNADRRYRVAIAALALCACGCLSLRKHVTLHAAALPAPFSAFTRFPFYAYNQTAIQGQGEYGQVPIDFLVVLSNHTTTSIMVPDCESLWPNSVDIEIRTPDGGIHELEPSGVVSVRPADAMKSLLLVPGGSIAYPVVLDQRLFQNLPCLTVGDGFHVRARMTWTTTGTPRSSIVQSEWTAMAYKTTVDVGHPTAQHGSPALPGHAAPWLRDEGDVEVEIGTDE